MSLKASAIQVLRRDRARDNWQDSAASAPKPTVPVPLLVSESSGTLAAAFLSAAERGAAAVAAGPADDIEAAEAQAIRELAELTAAEPPERHRELIRPLLMAALYRASRWPDAVGRPVTPGAFCGACHGPSWWWGADTTAVRSDSRLPGWHCARCHPPRGGCRPAPDAHWGMASRRDRINGRRQRRHPR